MCEGAAGGQVWAVGIALCAVTGCGVRVSLCVSSVQRHVSLCSLRTEHARGWCGVIFLGVIS
jgi:hypothetical protein